MVWGKIDEHPLEDERRKWARDLRDIRLRLKRFYEGEVRQPRFKNIVFERLERIQNEIYDLSEGQGQ